MNESCSERFKLYIVTMKFEIRDKRDLVHFCRSILTNNFKEVLLIALSLQILSRALSLQIKFLG